MVESDRQLTPSDRELIRRFQESSDQDAFDLLVQRHSSRAFQIAYCSLNNREDAEEVVQDAFLRIFRGLKKFRGDAEFTTWMYRIVVNLCNNKYRWNKTRGKELNFSIDAPLASSDGSSPLKLDLPDERTLAPDDQLAFEELQQRTRQAMAQLPESYRLAVLLRNVKELDYDQIAKILDCAVGTVKSRINRGREILRQKLSP